MKSSVQAATTWFVKSPWLRFVLGILFAGVLFFYCRTVFMVPKDMDLPGDGISFRDPQVMAAYEKARSNVIGSPTSAVAWAQLGLLFAAHHEDYPAIECLEQARALDEHEWRWPYFQSVLYAKSDLDVALSTVTKAIQKSSSEIWPRLRQADWLLSLGQVEAARQVFEALMQDYPDAAIVALGSSRVLFAEGDIQAAYENVQKALIHPSTQRAAHEHLARIEAMRGNTTQAADAATKARGLPFDKPWPDDPWMQAIHASEISKQAIFDKIVIAEQSGNIPATRELIRELVRLYPEVDLLAQGELEMQKSNFLAAEKYFRAGLSFDPSSIELEEFLAEAVAQQGRKEEAAELLQNILSREPSYAPAWRRLAEYLSDIDPEASRKAAAQAAWYGQAVE